MLPSVAYLNHAGTSWPKPAPVRAAVESALATPPEAFQARFEAESSALPGQLGAHAGDRLVLTPGCTSALSVAVGDHPWESGDRVLCSGWEHHALHRALVQLAGRGVELLEVPPGTPASARRNDGSRAPVDLDELERALAAGSVRLVALTAACNVTGELLPIREVVERAHAHGASVLVDAAQVAGWMPLREVAPGADLIAFAGHKGPQAPWGIGGLLAAERVELASPAATCELPPPGGAPVCGTLPGYCDVGSVDRLALSGLVAGLAWLAEPERADRLSVARGLVETLVDAALELGGVTLHGPREAGRRMPTAAFTVAGKTPGALADELAARGVHASGGFQCAPLAHRTLGTEAGGVLRFSAGPATTADDIAAAIGALRELLPPA